MANTVRGDLGSTVRKILADIMPKHVKLDRVAEHENLVALGLDSISVISVILAIEERYGFMFADDDLRLRNFSTIAQIRAAIAQGLKQAPVSK